jgi:hypothetical protein
VGEIRGDKDRERKGCMQKVNIEWDRYGLFESVIG